jgi:hypothetical protein
MASATIGTIRARTRRLRLRTATLREAQGDGIRSQGDSLGRKVTLLPPNVTESAKNRLDSVRCVNTPCCSAP